MLPPDPHRIFAEIVVGYFRYAEQLGRQQNSLMSCIQVLHKQLCAEVAQRDRKHAAELRSKCSIDNIFRCFGLDPFNTNTHDREESSPESLFHPLGDEGFLSPTTIPGFKKPCPPQAPNRPTLTFQAAFELTFDPFK